MLIEAKRRRIAEYRKIAPVKVGQQTASSGGDMRNTRVRSRQPVYRAGEESSP